MNSKIVDMRYIIFIACILIVAACSYENRPCEFESKDVELTIYNHVLTDLIENRMHARYLGGVEDEIFNKYKYRTQDSIAFKNDIAKAQNHIFNKPSKFCTLYLDTVTQPVYLSWLHLDTAASGYAREVKQLILQYTKHGQAAVDSLNQNQTRYTSKDFALCTARIKNLADLKPYDTTECVFGRLRLSKIVLDSLKNKGMLHYDWHCGNIGLCGHRGLILFERQGSQYKIKDLAVTVVY